MHLLYVKRNTKQPSPISQYIKLQAAGKKGCISLNVMIFPMEFTLGQLDASEYYNKYWAHCNNYILNGFAQKNQHCQLLLNIGH